MPGRGIRGATTVACNEAGEILEATRAMLQAIVEQNGLSDENINNDMVSVIFTATTDLDAVYPAVAAREMGWTNVPLLCMQEMDVAGSLTTLHPCVDPLEHRTRRNQKCGMFIWVGRGHSART